MMAQDNSSILLEKIPICHTHVCGLLWKNEILTLDIIRIRREIRKSLNFKINVRACEWLSLIWPQPPQ